MPNYMIDFDHLVENSEHQRILFLLLSSNPNRNFWAAHETCLLIKLKPLYHTFIYKYLTTLHVRAKHAYVLCCDTMYYLYKNYKENVSITSFDVSESRSLTALFSEKSNIPTEATSSELQTIMFKTKNHIEKNLYRCGDYYISLSHDLIQRLGNKPEIKGTHHYEVIDSIKLGQGQYGQIYQNLMSINLKLLEASPQNKRITEDRLKNFMPQNNLVIKTHQAKPKVIKIEPLFPTTERAELKRIRHQFKHY